MFRKYIYCIICSFFVLICFSCKNRTDREEQVGSLIAKWEGRTVIFPNNAVFTVLGRDTVSNNDLQSDYKVVVYADAVGCISCKLKLSKWKKIISELGEVSDCKISFLFYLYPNSKEEIVDILEQNHFNYPVCFDFDDSFNKLNKLPDNEKFHVLLLDGENKVILMGNPVNNSKIKDLYLKVILKDKYELLEDMKKTTILANTQQIDLNRINYKQEVYTEFILSNTGNAPLVLMDVTTSCGCTSVEYDKKPVQPGEELKLIVKYKADEPGHFSKSIKVFCNADESPLSLRIIGEALSD